MEHLPAELLNEFQELIYKECSLRFSSSRLINLEKRLIERIKTRNLQSGEEYFRLLQKDGEEFSTLIEGITTKETHFFRLPGQFNAFAHYAIPRIEERLLKQAQEIIIKEGWSGPRRIPVRIWSAACATGEEPYSIAMTLMNSLRYPKAWNIEILATDISREALMTAQNGLYEEVQIARIPVKFRKRYMRMERSGASMSDELIQAISFRIFNLRNLNSYRGSFCTFVNPEGGSETIPLFERFDMIFCRNVMIYFDFQAQQQLIDNLYLSLKPGGYLFTGDAEILHIYEHGFDTLNWQGVYLYQKPERELDQQ